MPVDQGRETLTKASFKGLWSVKIVKFLPFQQKTEVLERRVGSKLIPVKVEYFHSAADSFLEKKARGPRSCCRTEPSWNSEASTAREI